MNNSTKLAIASLLEDPDAPSSSPVLIQNETIPLSPKVPNKHPTIQTKYRIAVIGEAPGKDEVAALEPFVGQSGKLLMSILSKKGVIRDGIFIGNICLHRPPNNDISKFDFKGPEIQGGLEQLEKDLKEFNPHICILLGKTALYAAKGTYAISDWRGSFFVSDRGPFLGRKCLATYHPAYCLRQYEAVPLLMFDVQKAVAESFSPDLVLPNRNLEINLTCDEILSRLLQISLTKPKIALDIEGGLNSWSCISIATSPTQCFIIPWTNKAGYSYWSVDDECSILLQLSAILADPSIPKVLQNSLYDRFILQYGYDIIIRGVVDDTMLKSWEKYCELDKNLGFLCSIYTKEPFYKSDIDSDDMETFWRYCCRDSATTLEISNYLDSALDPGQRSHYTRNIELLNVLLYCEIEGMKYDHEKAKERKEECDRHIFSLQYQLDSIANITVPTTLSEVQAILCFRRDPSRPKSGNEESYDKAVKAFMGELSEADKGFLSTVCKTSMNVRSPIFKKYLYETLKLPVQYKKNKDGELRPTTDYEALLKLTKKSNHPSLSTAININIHRTRSQMLSILPANDGRMHCSYNLVGTETARISSSRSMIFGKDGNKVRRVGTNMQTVSDDWDIDDEDLALMSEGLRSLYLADDDCDLAECDLKGSDGWTIGAYMAMLGDPTMLDDLKYGLKPAQKVAYVIRHGVKDMMRPREEQKELLKEIRKEDWDYFCSKGLIWGACYLMGPRKAADQILKESWGKVVLTESEAKQFQAAVFSIYNVKVWHRWMERELARTKQVLIAPNGFRRKFFGRYNEILGQALAHMPQVITTAATKAAMYRCWTDPENRIEGTNLLKVRPSHTVHDSFVCQWKKVYRDWAINKLRQWFDNSIIVAGQTITIPFDGSFGKSWGEKTEGKI